MHLTIHKLFTRKQLIFICTFTSLIVATIGCLSFLKVTLNKNSNFSEPKWKTATFLPDSLKKKFKSDVLDNSRNWDTFFQEVVATKVEVNGHSLFIVDTSINQSSQNPLCGVKGCLISGFLNDKGDWKKVFSGYFLPFVEPGKPHLELQNSFDDLPCIKISQYFVVNNHLQKTDFYCFDNQEQLYFRR